MAQTTVRSVCPYCGVGCGIVMTVADNRVIKVAGDKQHPTNRGRLCTKGSSCHMPIADAGRMEHAWVRQQRERDPVRVPIDQAISETARRLRAIIDRDGPDAVALYVSGQMSLEAQYLANKLAKGFIRTRHIESNSRLCMASAGTGYKQSLGADGPPGSYQDFDAADLFFVTGANMADCHPILFLRLLDRVKAGARLIVVDPRRSATADKADLFLQIRPGTDLALLNGLLHLLHANGHTAPAFIDQYTDGWEAMPAFLAEYTPEHVAEITGLAQADIRKAAEWIGLAPNWMSCWTMGLNQSTHGTWNTNALCNLHLATGAICREGSGPFSLTGQPNAMGGREMGYMGPGLPGQRSALLPEDRRFVEQRWHLPAGTLREESGAGTVALFKDMAAKAVKACWIICTNPVASVANRQQVIEGLQAAELVISQDAFLDTETNRYADILLPGALWAEADGVLINSERNLTLAPKAVEGPGESLPDWQIIARVACEMGYAESFSYTSAEQVFEEIRGFWNPATGYDLRGISYPLLREAPAQWPIAPGTHEARHPIRYLNDGLSQQVRFSADGARPAFAFPTATGKAKFLARPHMPPAEMPDEHFPLVLNTGRLQHQWHTLTKTGKVATLNKLNPGPFVEIHPEDASRLGIGEADQVAVRSRRGEAILPARISDRVLPGNCFAPFHWNDVYGPGLAINAVTSDAVDRLSYQPEFKFAAVSLCRVGSPRLEVAQLPSDQALAAGTEEASTMRDDLLANLLGEAVPASPVTLEADEALYMRGFLLGLESDRGRANPGLPTLPANAPIARERRLLLEGMLAGIFSRAPAVSQPAQATALHLVLWGSQTGNAEGFAQQCVERLHGQGLRVKACAMNEVSLHELQSASAALLVASTFGDGDAPDNASEFWASLQQPSATLPGLRYAVLALGDSSYDQFCGFGRKLDEHLSLLGAQRLLKRGECEPDYEEIAGQWLDEVSMLLTLEAPVTAGAPLSQADTWGQQSAGKSPALYSRQRPYKAKLLRNRLLNAPGAQKETRQIVFDLKGSGLEYQAGDALGIWPTNCLTLVEELLDCLGLDSGEHVQIKGQGDMPLAMALHRHLDITRITPEWLAFVAQRSASEQLASLLAPEHKAQLNDWLWGRQLLDLLEAFPVALSQAELLGLLKPLQPRLYSISSSPKVTPDEVHLTVSTVRYRCNDRARSGVCSGFLADRAEQELVSIFVQPSAQFRVPGDSHVPMIMVGPGTGIAPFRAFLQERRASGATGQNWLVFGEQYESSDFYYRDELDNWQREGHLHQLSTAFSRDQAQKIYVQHRLLEQGAQLWQWLEEGAHFYICGDAARMAKDVEQALKAAIREHGGLDETQAQAYVSALARDKRYLRDVY